MALRPNQMGIIEIDGAFHWSVGFAGDPRLPRMGTAESFEKADAAIRRLIRMARKLDPIATVDRRVDPQT